MKLKFSQRLIDYLIQAIFIFISVFMAFWLNDYQTKQEEQRITQDVKNAINQELTKNLAALEEIEVHHTAIYSKSIDFFKTKIDTITRFDFTQIPGFPQTSRNMVLTSGASNLGTDYRVHLHMYVKSRISSVYEEQKLYNETYKKLYDEFLFSPKLHDQELVRENYLEFYNLITKIKSREQALITNMKEVIKQINY